MANPQLASSLAKKFKQHAHIRMNGRVASSKTINVRMQSITQSFNQLEALGYRLQDASNISEKHVRALVQHWLKVKKLSPKTIEGNLSCLRIFCSWIGKDGMIKGKYNYVTDEQRPYMKVNTAAKASKSLTGNDVNIDELFERVDRYDSRLGLMLRLELAFGLRREEILKCKPHHQDFGSYLAVFKGHGKGGRERNIQAMTTAQREIIDMIKRYVGKNESLGWPTTRSGATATLKQNLKRYSNSMASLGITKESLGVTGHSFRAQFAENNALAHGVVPGSLGGTKGQMAKDEMKMRMARLSEAMGHHRIEVMTAYYCSFGNKATLDRADHCMRTIDQSTALLSSVELAPVDEEYRDDCIFIRNTTEVLEVEITLKQIQHLWTMYSQRNGVAWVKPEREIGICIESSALEIIRQAEKNAGQLAA